MRSPSSQGVEMEEIAGQYREVRADGWIILEISGCMLLIIVRDFGKFKVQNAKFKVIGDLENVSLQERIAFMG